MTFMLLWRRRVCQLQQNEPEVTQSQTQRCIPQNQKHKRHQHLQTEARKHIDECKIFVSETLKFSFWTRQPWRLMGCQWSFPPFCLSRHFRWVDPWNLGICGVTLWFHDFTPPVLTSDSHASLNQRWGIYRYMVCLMPLCVLHSQKTCGATAVHLDSVLWRCVFLLRTCFDQPFHDLPLGKRNQRHRHQNWREEAGCGGRSGPCCCWATVFLEFPWDLLCWLYCMYVCTCIYVAVYTFYLSCCLMFCRLALCMLLWSSNW